MDLSELALPWRSEHRPRLLTTSDDSHSCRTEFRSGLAESSECEHDREGRQESGSEAWDGGSRIIVEGTQHTDSTTLRVMEE